MKNTIDLSTVRIVGILIGGGIIWFTASIVLNRQFQFKMKMRKLTEQKTFLKSLIAVETELTYNLFRLEETKKMMVDAEVNLIYFGAKSQFENLKKDVWETLAHELAKSGSKDLFNELNKFYSDISMEIENRYNDLRRCEFLFKHGIKCISLLKIEIQIVESKISNSL